MTGSSIGTIVARLGESLRLLESAGSSLAAARRLTDEFLEGCRELGVEYTVSQVEVLIDRLAELAVQLQEAESHVTALVGRAESLGSRGVSPVRSSADLGETISPRGGAATLTQPSQAPEAAAVPEGEPEPVDPRSSSVKQSSIRIQNASAKMIAEAGFRIRQLPAANDRQSPDFQIEGHDFDCYAPLRGATVDAVRTKLRKKIKQGQADRFVVNLDRCELSAEELRQHLARAAPTRLKEVLVIKRDRLVRVWP